MSQSEGSYYSFSLSFSQVTKIIYISISLFSHAFTDSFSLSYNLPFLSFIINFHLNFSCWDRFRHWSFILLSARWSTSFIPFLPMEGHMEQIFRNRTITFIRQWNSYNHQPQLGKVWRRYNPSLQSFGNFLVRFTSVDILSYF